VIEMMLNPVINWFGRQVPDPAYETFDAALFRRFLIQTLTTPSRNTKKALRILAETPHMDEDEKDKTLERLVKDEPFRFQDLDWRDYK
tara:strand:+ start:1401 stop:1664 length:264 start_codon:yes stop_codon:yes gene_type:complete